MNDDSTLHRTYLNEEANEYTREDWSTYSTSTVDEIISSISNSAEEEIVCDKLLLGLNGDPFNVAGCTRGRDMNNRQYTKINIAFDESNGAIYHTLVQLGIHDKVLLADIYSGLGHLHGSLPLGLSTLQGEFQGVNEGVQLYTGLRITQAGARVFLSRSMKPGPDGKLTLTNVPKFELFGLMDIQFYGLRQMEFRVIQAEDHFILLATLEKIGEESWILDNAVYMQELSLSARLSSTPACPGDVLTFDFECTLSMNKTITTLEGLYWEDGDFTISGEAHGLTEEGIIALFGADQFPECRFSPASSFLTISSISGMSINLPGFTYKGEGVEIQGGILEKSIEGETRLRAPVPGNSGLEPGGAWIDLSWKNAVLTEKVTMDNQGNKVPIGFEDIYYAQISLE
ncbi:hypothetical protein RSOLAG22IIIB_09895 [Rhizoctonia solani]|uniref:Uncharacterized protein n=1 Tax=Rhizoctonia solani TaxID=456999 RepID=A0A0K6G0L5_9AGAM|nr:hypothetical protein RSOLAG22IIIB_09895 [Rhizoctonia solani]